MLVAKCGNLPLDKIDEQLATLGAKAPDVTKAIQIAAFNDNLKTNGRPDGLVREPRPTRLVRVMI